VPIDIDSLAVFRILPVDNLEDDLTNGLYSKLNAPKNPQRVVIGNDEIITERDKRIVKCYPDTVVNNYIPFYFSVRTPMLYNIVTGHGVPKKDQKDIIYLCTPILNLANNLYQWCFTNGNAAKKITRYYTDLQDLNKLDWKSIRTTDFRTSNADGDEDRIRKKHAEFLVKDHIITDEIHSIVVLNDSVKTHVEGIVDRVNAQINVVVNPNNKYYFNGIY
jgi:hypothetical protein